mmetsp:Transcript_868/g.1969  ORF Transcript_868/g.1969 Transcript_868/m.1969 type:complete len:202 (-) Transcript_868:693-1298(-)
MGGIAPTFGRTKPKYASLGSAGSRMKCSAGRGSSISVFPSPALLRNGKRWRYPVARRTRSASTCRSPWLVWNVTSLGPTRLMLPSIRSMSRSTSCTAESHHEYIHLRSHEDCFLAFLVSSGMHRDDLLTMCFRPSSQLKLCLLPTHWLKPYEHPVVRRKPSLVNLVVTHQCIPTRCAQLLSQACVAKFMMMQSKGGVLSPK